MNTHSGYFELPTLRTVLVAIDRRLNPYRHRQSVIVRDTPVEVWWTDRAERALAQRDTPLTAEMQLYFSCVVKKRVLFHEQSELEGIPVDSRLQILFRPVESTSCDPEEFAHDFPVKREFQSPAARKLKPAVLEIDYRHGIWRGEFYIGTYPGK